MKSFLVTGSKGFIGTHLTRELKEKNFDVIKFDISDGKDITKWEDVKKDSESRCCFPSCC